MGASMKITVCESGTDFAKKDAPSIREPAHVAALLKDLAKSDTEFFAVLSLNQKYRLIALDVIAMGTANACIASPRDVYRTALQRNAVAVIVAHNHPSGDTTPSAEDVAVTRQTVAAGKTVEIKCLDSIIVGRTDEETPTAYSLREAGLVEFA